MQHLEKLRSILNEQLGVPPEEIAPSSRLTEDFMCDSLDLVELVMAVEEEFGITITDDESAACYTVEDIHALVAAKVPA